MKNRILSKDFLIHILHNYSFWLIKLGIIEVELNLRSQLNNKMTTAHRPTWNTAKGGSEQGGNLLVEPSRAYSALDLPAHLKLKSRQIG